MDGWCKDTNTERQEYAGQSSQGHREEGHAEHEQEGEVAAFVQEEYKKFVELCLTKKFF